MYRELMKVQLETSWWKEKFEKFFKTPKNDQMSYFVIDERFELLQERMV
jgi:hypothetical protein